MPIDPLSVWQKTFDAIPRTDKKAWAGNIANWVDGRVTGKAQLTGIITATPPFTFNKSIFKSELERLGVTPASAVGGSTFSVAWMTAMTGSLILKVVSGDYMGSPAPATKWSVVITALVDPDSVALAMIALNQAITAGSKCKDPSKSKIPEIFRNAFLALTGSVTGINSIPPPAGPQPLMAPKMKFM